MSTALISIYCMVAPIGGVVPLYIVVVSCPQSCVYRMFTIRCYNMLY